MDIATQKFWRELDEFVYSITGRGYFDAPKPIDPATIGALSAQARFHCLTWEQRNTIIDRRRTRLNAKI